MEKEKFGWTTPAAPTMSVRRNAGRLNASRVPANDPSLYRDIVRDLRNRKRPVAMRVAPLRFAAVHAGRLHCSVFVLRTNLTNG